jgi:signal transduction histidine kinase
MYLAPPILLGSLELLRQVFFPDLFETRWLYLTFLLVAIAGMWLFAWGVGRTVERLQGSLLHQNQELLALHEASIAITSDLELESVLQRVVDEATTLVGATYGAISYARAPHKVDMFVTHGIADDVRAAIGPLPEGHGLIGAAMASGVPIRIDDIGADPRSVGFPAHHPPMDQLLGVPIVGAGGIAGNLYLTDKPDGSPFTSSDEQSLRRFAALAAIAIDNAVLHEQVQVLAITAERERIAREMHDSLAQVLAYVNTKSQAALAHLAHGDRDAARAQIEQLAASAREAYVDVREGIFGLRNASPTAQRSVFDALGEYLVRWQDQGGIPVVATVSDAARQSRLTPLAEIHLLRLIQEALTNVRKHANATRVSIAIDRRGVQLQLEIVDNGSGFDPAAIAPGGHPRFGLSTMRERAEASGGTFDLESTPGEGTTIRVALPAGPG